MIQANVKEEEEQTMARFLNGLNHPIKKIANFQPYSTLINSCTKLPRRSAKCKKTTCMPSTLPNHIVHTSLNDYNAFYLNQTFYKHRRQVKLQENFDIFKSSSYYKQLQAESFIINNSTGRDHQDKFHQMLHMRRLRPHVL